MASGRETTLATHEGVVAVGVVLTVPPFPYPDGYERRSKGMPICGETPFTFWNGTAFRMRNSDR